MFGIGDSILFAEKEEEENWSEATSGDRYSAPPRRYPEPERYPALQPYKQKQYAADLEDDA